MVRPSILISSLVTALASSSSRAQTITNQVVGTQPGGQFGHAIDTLADADGDGADELIVGAPMAAGGGSVSRLAVDGTVAWEVFGAPGEAYGQAVAVLGDVDLDGIEDVAAGAPLAPDGAGTARGRVDVLSGADGSVLYSIVGALGSGEFGSSVAALGDIDGDGVGDFAAGGPAALGQRGYVRGYSGATGAFRFARLGQISTERFGHALAGVGDADGDGIPDVAVGGPFVAGSTFAGVVRLVSGANGAVRWSTNGDAPQDAFGSALAALSDQDGDGVLDALVGAPQSGAATGFVRALSGSSGAAIVTITGTESGAGFGHAVQMAGDVDGDGQVDLAVGLPRSDAGATDGGALELVDLAGTSLGQLVGTQPGEAFGHAVVLAPGLGVDVDLAVGAPGAASGDGAVALVSTAPPPPLGPTLAGDVSSVSLSAREKQTLSIDAGPAHAGEKFLVLGSASGTQPGLQVGSWLIPLVPDCYFRMTLFRRARTLCPPSGRLDQNGRATVVFSPGRLGRRFVGKTLHHAAVLLDRRQITGVTNAEPVTILP